MRTLICFLILSASGCVGTQLRTTFDIDKLQEKPDISVKVEFSRTF